MMNKVLDYSEKINIFLIFLVSFSVNYYYGSIGVLPIDTFAFLIRQILLIKVIFQFEIIGPLMVFLLIFFNRYFLKS